MREYLLNAAIIITLGIYAFIVGRQDRKIKQLTKERDTWKALVDQRANTAQQFLNSCRLIDIKRDTRFNYFTFARGNDVFTIETMGILSDTPDEWRKQAGLMYVGN